jgi:CubicO group peptidase (beta-lactamase class C family)
MNMTPWSVLVALFVLFAAPPGLLSAQAPTESSARPSTEAAARHTAEVDAIFERWDSPDSPGCAVAVGQNGSPVLTRAYGMADLEHDIPNSAETIFEAGSVSKQFTVAAVALLALDGRLSLDDDVRTYVP